MDLYKLGSDVQLRVIQGGVASIDENQLTSTLMQGVVKMTSEQLEQQRLLTDSLRIVVQDYRDRETEAVELLPVLQALFPKVKKIAISHTLITQVESQETTPSTIVIAYVTEPLDEKERQDLHKWLVARKGTTALQLFVQQE
jgi:hypothetical protein